MRKMEGALDVYMTTDLVGILSKNVDTYIASEAVILGHIVLSPSVRR